VPSYERAKRARAIGCKEISRERHCISTPPLNATPLYVSHLPLHTLDAYCVLLHHVCVCCVLPVAARWCQPFFCSSLAIFGYPGFGDGVSDTLPAACGRAPTMQYDDVPCRWSSSACYRRPQRPPLHLHSTVMMRFSSGWCSCSPSVADLALLACCPPGMHCMSRSPTSWSDRASAYPCDAFARIQRLIRAEMAENETI